MKRALLQGLWLIFVFVCIGCQGQATDLPMVVDQAQTPTMVQLVTVMPMPTLTATPKPIEPKLALDEAIPDALRQRLEQQDGLLADPGDVPNLRFGVVKQAEAQWMVNWVYALVAPFGTVTDEAPLTAIRAVWQGVPEPEQPLQTLYLAPETRMVFTALWGEADENYVHAVAADELLRMVWDKPASWAIVPFEQLQPRWKVMRVDGHSPFDWDFESAEYALTVRFGVQGQEEARLQLSAQSPLPESNRDPQLLTVVVMTGTTAMVRHTAEKMELNGLDYPYAMIQPWLESGDFLHISNEAAFYADCPPALPFRNRARFCSAPGYFAVLQALGVDIVELTGNHLLDWGIPAMQETLNLYQQNGIQTYGGGQNLDAARAALRIEHHGNRFAFVGCNAVGPQTVYATRNTPGAAPCDLAALEKMVHDLRQEGYLPIVTFQHLEVESNQAPSALRTDFRQMARAGAVIVSGSQAHVPHGFGFIAAVDGGLPEGFLSYGLGNLFFDQMFPLARPGLIERHVFYDGRYLGNEILVTMLEDSAQRRPATLEERKTLLNTLFAESDLKLP
jgi:poly-gamma-glutamate synthesis protein (capsule biosynthesis protein)